MAALVCCGDGGSVCLIVVVVVMVVYLLLLLFSGWWFVNVDDFHEGWVPATYLDPLYGTEDMTVQKLDVGEGEKKGQLILAVCCLSLGWVPYISCMLPLTGLGSLY